MGFFTSDSFASVSAAGTDWRDTSKKVLEMLEKARTDDDGFNIGFIYISDNLVGDARSIINLFRSITCIEHWVGSIGLCVCGTGEEYIDEPAIAVMIGRIDSADFCVFPAIDLSPEPAKTMLEAWMDGNKDPMLVLAHGDPFAEADPILALTRIEQITGGFVVGGMSSSRKEHLQFADDVMQGGISGVAFSQDVLVASTLTQGFAPAGPLHTITRCEENIVIELDGQRAFDVFVEDLHALSVQKGRDYNETNEFHVAFPVARSDQQDYMVRNALRIDPDSGRISVAHNITNGEQMMFVHRDSNTVRADLSRALIELRQRVKDENGEFAPKGALYISSVARTMSDFGDGHKNQKKNKEEGGEMALVREIIGDVPLAGFYANGEISNHRLYGYTAILILFL